MFKNVKRLFSILKCINIDTHLWCISVLCGAILLCVSFFVEPSQRQFVMDDKEDVKIIADHKVIEYSSVLGSLSGIETLEDEQVEEIVDAIPHIDEIPEETAAAVGAGDIISGNDLADAAFDNDDDPSSVTLVASSDNDVDISKVFSTAEIDALERLVQCEAATEDLDGRTLVANVVLNRVDTGIWGNDILSVIESPGQFDPVTNGAVKTAEVDPITRKAVIGAMAGDDNSQGAVYFQKCNAKIWGDKQYLFRYGSHSFYK